MTASSYTLNIDHPENIQDLVYGNIPIKMRDIFTIDRSNTYSETLTSTPQDFAKYFSLLAVVCVLTFLFDI